MKGLRLLKGGEWNKPPVLMAARRILIQGLADHCNKRSLGDAASFLNGTSYDVAQLDEFGTAPIIRISNITDPSSSYLRTREHLDRKFWINLGDLLVSWSASFKSIVWPGPEGYLNQHIFKVTERPGFDRRYIRHAIEASFDEMQENVVGIGMMHLRRADFLGHPIPAPPLETQKAVADYLDSIEAGGTEKRAALPQILEKQWRVVARIEELAAQIHQARTLRHQATEEAEAFLASALNTACSGRITSRPEANESARQLLDRISQLEWPGHVKARPRKPMSLPPPPDVPDSWLVVEAGELQQRGAILDIQDGNHGGDYPRKAEFGDKGVAFVTAKQFDNGTVRIAEAPRLPRDRASRLRIGFARATDVLLTHNASVGDVAIAPADSGEFLLGTSATYWRCNPEALNGRYLFYFMRSGHFQGQLQFIMKQTTRNQVSVLKQVNLWICFPPLSEQLRIVAELDALQAEINVLKRLQAETAAELDALLPAILDKAFKGEL